MSLALVEQSLINVLGVDDLGLMLLLVKDGESQGFGLVEQGHLTVRIFADGDPGIAQGIGGAFGLDLVDDILELEGQVLGEGARLLPGQDVGQVF